VNGGSPIGSPAPVGRLPSVAPYLLVPGLMLAGFAAIPDPPAYITLTVAGLTMGLMIFIMASGLTVVFGLLDVINFGHGAFITIGAFAGFALLGRLTAWSIEPSWIANLSAIALAVLVAALAAAAAGFVFERVIVRPVYGAHLKQILVTTGGLILAEQLVYVFFGVDALHVSRPAMLQGSFIFGDVAIEKYRVLAVAIGVSIAISMRWTLRHTRVGLLVRAGVENREMVEALGYRIRGLFVAVFVVASALAGVGGILWGLYQETITATIGSEMMVLVFIVVIIGGLGSVEGCFIGALLVGLLNNYASFLAPQFAPVSTIVLMVAVLMARPEGLVPVIRSA
jgi:branched-chain amino acid transport system permease protein